MKYFTTCHKVSGIVTYQCTTLGGYDYVLYIQYTVSSVVVSGTCDNCLLLYYGATPLHLAAICNHYDVCLVLLQHGASVEMKNLVIILSVCYFITV